MLPCGRHENRRAKVALAGGKCQYRRAEAVALAGLDDTTADHVVTAVEHRGLPGTEGALWRVEMHTQRVVVEGLNPCRCGRSGIPHFHRDLGGGTEQAAVEKIEVFYEAGGAEQALFWTKYNRVG